jgi:hypothetical protein
MEAGKRQPRIKYKKLSLYGSQRCARTRGFVSGTGKQVDINQK